MYRAFQEALRTARQADDAEMDRKDVTQGLADAIQQKPTSARPVSARRDDDARSYGKAGGPVWRPTTAPALPPLRYENRKCMLEMSPRSSTMLSSEILDSQSSDPFRADAAKNTVLRNRQVSGKATIS